MTRMFKRWISLLIGLFLPTMMISFLYHKNEILQKKIALSLQPDQRLFPKSLPADETSSSVWQRLAFSTPFYRVERGVDEQISLPIARSGMMLEDTMQSKPPKKQTLTTRAAIEIYPIRDSEVTVGTTERKGIIPNGNDVSRTVKLQTAIKKRPSKRSRRTNRKQPVKHLELSQQVNLDLPVKSIEELDKSDDKQKMLTSAPVVVVTLSSNKTEEVAKVFEKHDGSTVVSPVESADIGQSTAATTTATIVVRSTSKTKTITEIANIAKDDLDIKFVNKTNLDGSIQTSDQEKTIEQKIQSPLVAPSRRKSKKRQVKSEKSKDRNVVEVIDNDEKVNVTISERKLENLQIKTDNKDGVIQTILEQMTQENNITMKSLSKKDDTKRKRDRKSRARRKSHPKEVELKEPVTLPLKFNLNNSNSHSPMILASTNNAFLNFTDNWLESVKRSGIKSGVTLVAEDREAFNYLKDRTDIELNVVLNDVSESPGERLLFDSPAYKQLVNKRPSYILQLLSSGHDVLFSDVDIVWLKNPLPYFTNDTNDIWLQEDLHEPAVYCAGFTFYRSTPATIALVTEWVENLALHPTYPDQRVLNGLLRKKRWQGDNIKRAVMDSRLFPSGHLYFDPEWREANKDAEQVMIHNNWIVGHDRKIERFKNEGLWYLHDKETQQGLK